jgi:hypothetical protein
MKKLYLLAALLFLLPPHLANSKDILGMGTTSCGTWLAAKDDVVPRTIYGEWILGFISGSNWQSQVQARPVDSPAVYAFVDQYCTNNPLHMLTLAAAAVVEATGGPKALHKWKR